MERAQWFLAAAMVGLIGVALLFHGPIALAGAICLFAGAAYSLYHAFKPHTKIYANTSAAAVNKQGEGRGYSQAPALQPQQSPPQQQPQAVQVQNNSQNQALPPIDQPPPENKKDTNPYPEWEPSPEVTNATATQQVVPSAGQSVS